MVYRLWNSSLSSVPVLFAPVLFVPGFSVSNWIPNLSISWILMSKHMPTLIHWPFCRHLLMNLMRCQFPGLKDMLVTNLSSGSCDPHVVSGFRPGLLPVGGMAEKGWADGELFWDMMEWKMCATEWWGRFGMLNMLSNNQTIFCLKDR